MRRLTERYSVRFDRSTSMMIERLLDDDSFTLRNGFNKSDLVRHLVTTSLKNYQNNHQLREN